MVNWWVVHQPRVYVHPAICETSWVVTGVAWIYAQLGGWIHQPWVYVQSSIHETY